MQHSGLQQIRHNVIGLPEMMFGGGEDVENEAVGGLQNVLNDVNKNIEMVTTAINAAGKDATDDTEITYTLPNGNKTTQTLNYTRGFLDFLKIRKNELQNEIIDLKDAEKARRVPASLFGGKKLLTRPESHMMTYIVMLLVLLGVLWAAGVFKPKKQRGGKRRRNRKASKGRKTRRSKRRRR